MEERIEEEKHEIALLTELTLYNRIRSFDEDKSINQIDREKMKKEAIEIFVEECAERYKTLTTEQIKEHVLFKLNRTIENIKRLTKKDDAR